MAGGPSLSAGNIGALSIPGDLGDGSDPSLTDDLTNGAPDAVYSNSGALAVKPSVLVGGSIVIPLAYAAESCKRSGACSASNGYIIHKIIAILDQIGGKGSNAQWLKKEIKIGKIRINPNGDKTSNNPNGRRPHYHRRRTDSNGDTIPGQGIGRHRPWDTRSTDTSFRDRF
jgi:hypothetical protein